MGDPSRLTLPCGFRNSTIINDLADSRASINLMPYSFYKKLAFLGLKNTRMTILMEDHSITHPRDIVEDLQVKARKFIFPMEFVVLDRK